MAKKLIDLVAAELEKKEGGKLIPSGGLQTLLDLLYPDKCFEAFILDIEDPKYDNAEIHVITDARVGGRTVFVGDGCNFRDFSSLTFIREEVAEMGSITYYGASFREPCYDCPYCGCECDTGCAAAPFSTYSASDMPLSMELLEDVLCDWDAPDPDDDQEHLGDLPTAVLKGIQQMKILSIIMQKDADPKQLLTLNKTFEALEELETTAKAAQEKAERKAVLDSKRPDGLPHLLNPKPYRPTRDAEREELPYIE